MTALDAFADAMRAYASQDLEAAARAAARAATLAPSSRTFRETARYLESVRRDGKRAVYVAPDAFAAFIRGGGNVRLYERTSAALRAAYRELGGGIELLDIGVGDGLALLPALDEHVAAVTLVEPSAAMLAAAAGAVTARGVRCEALCTTVQAFQRAAGARRWDLAQATFSLQGVPPAERAVLWPWLRDAARRLLVVEFDVPRFDDPLSPAHVAHVAQRYEAGLAEYDGDGGLVSQGFLVPVMCGYFDPTVARTNYEQPIGAWLDELRAAGFASVTERAVDDYWWAPARLIDARP